MTREEKINWLKNATDEQLLKQYLSLNAGNRYGEFNEDIDLTEAEILKRMKH